MRNSKVLIDTSIWIDYFRGQNKEILEGVKEAKDREILKGTLDAIDYRE